MRPVRNRGTWLSLFAMLMIFIGPLISQAMPMDQHAAMSMSASMPMSASMDMAIEAPACQSADLASVATDHVIWAKCGYCTLLFSCPAVPQALAFIGSSPPKPSSFYRADSQPGHARQTTFPHARSRAPPLSITR
ncbi:DUF2946 domain-containing protein [Pseudomonas sp. CCI3.2]|uniref:DUF2946 domain-containing protein n=1 Tax=unclassified Pseudomonas TaxID=196821 RepID=UPI002AC9E949|nr:MULTISPECIES: DUF2946 domain-containing protein [unclassified Pseudomonas]MEB0079315.1 DUF2946 domain-containing protein [Pseudomonas sp. MH10out]MEB0093327.1 DUF2946 domain-containing protein [Pseudomonas sp. CCI4.2]MEB0100961.1 DUF2946 domain-containing protein [Pseudomonas sp. CCI3.2]MEB0130558.1 DUF2946 domain-containing protein [Pseudomonas sp. CCI2.4]MEB0156870.1 DUF2946 domain-containing protein [Pseudomonas sp. AH2 (2023)]